MITALAAAALLQAEVLIVVGSGPEQVDLILKDPSQARTVATTNRWFAETVTLTGARATVLLSPSVVLKGNLNQRATILERLRGTTVPTVVHLDSLPQESRLDTLRLIGPPGAMSPLWRVAAQTPGVRVGFAPLLAAELTLPDGKKGLTLSFDSPSRGDSSVTSTGVTREALEQRARQDPATFGTDADPPTDRNIQLSIRTVGWLSAPGREEEVLVVVRGVLERVREKVNREQSQAIDDLVRRGLVEKYPGIKFDEDVDFSAVPDQIGQMLLSQLRSEIEYQNPGRGDAAVAALQQGKVRFRGTGILVELRLETAHGTHSFVNSVTGKWPGRP